MVCSYTMTTLTNAGGDVACRQAFDPWGRRRNPANLTINDNALPAGYSWLRGFTGHEHLPQFKLINMNARLYDPLLGRMLSPDNYVTDASNPMAYNLYSYANNNPISYVDPDGNFIFTALALIIPGAQVFLPIAIGADIGAFAGGIRGDMTPGVGFWKGATRGAVTGAIGGALGMVGGGSLVANIAWGATEGAITGGIDAALWGTNIGKGALQGAAIGAAFAAATSGAEAYGNYRQGHGFRTDEGVINNYIRSAKYDKAIDFVQENYGLNGVNMNYDANLNNDPKYVNATAVTNPQTGDVRVGPYSFGSADVLKRSVVHEYGHSTLDRVIGSNGRFTWKYPPKSFPTSNATINGDGPIGYAQEIYNSGRMNISRSVMQRTQGYDWLIKGSLRHNIPRRFNHTYKPFTGF